MKTIIRIHSFVDLITNSSSEIFVSASQSTVNAIKSLLSNVLKAAGSDRAVDDLFTIEIGYEVVAGEYGDQYPVNAAEFEKIKKAWYNRDEDEDEDAEMLRPYQPGDYIEEVTVVIVTAKDSASKEAKAAAEVLSDLTGLFQIDASCG